jgi:hypothetical protein
VTDPLLIAQQDQIAAQARDNTPGIVAKAGGILAEVGNRDEALARIALHLVGQDRAAIAQLAADAVLRLAEQDVITIEKDNTNA